MRNERLAELESRIASLSSRLEKHGTHDQSSHGNWSHDSGEGHGAIGGEFKTEGMDAKTIGRLNKHLDTKTMYEGNVMTNRDLYTNHGVGKKTSIRYKYDDSGNVASEKEVYGIITDAERSAFIVVPKIVYDAFQPNSGVSETPNVAKRQFSTQQREDLASEGKAMPDGSFPIANEQDLRNAIYAINRAKNPDAVKAHIKRRAKAMGAENLLPESW